VTPYLIVHDAAGALQFYQKAFGAKELMRFPGPNGKIMHAEIQLGDSKIMLADECPEMGYRSAESIGGSPVSLYVYLPDCDKVVEKAAAEGAKILKPVADQFYGDRSGFIQDPFGHFWGVATHTEDVSAEEIEKRAKQAMQAA